MFDNLVADNGIQPRGDCLTSLPIHWWATIAQDAEKRQ
jgi:hypothetical protein